MSQKRIWQEIDQNNRSRARLGELEVQQGEHLQPYQNRHLLKLSDQLDAEIARSKIRSDEWQVRNTCLRNAKEALGQQLAKMVATTSNVDLKSLEEKQKKLENENRDLEEQKAKLKKQVKELTQQQQEFKQEKETLEKLNGVMAKNQTRLANNFSQAQEEATRLRKDWNNSKLLYEKKIAELKEQLAEKVHSDKIEKVSMKKDT